MMDITQKKVKIQACFAHRLEQAMVSLLGDNPEEFWERLSEAEQEVVWVKWWLFFPNPPRYFERISSILG